MQQKAKENRYGATREKRKKMTRRMGQHEE
jgi:hypothetical protein